MKPAKRELRHRAPVPTTVNYHSSNPYDDIDVLDTDEDVVLHKADILDTDEDLVMEIVNRVGFREKSTPSRQLRRRAEVKNKKA